MNGKRWLFLICLLVCAALFGCSGEKTETRSIDIQTAAETLAAEGIYDDQLEQVEEDIALAFYGIDPADVSACRVYMSTAATAEEAAVFRAVDEAAAKRVLQAAAARVAAQAAVYAGYAPEETAKLEAARIETREGGLVVILCVSADKDGAAARLEEI